VPAGSDHLFEFNQVEPLGGSGGTWNGEDGQGIVLAAELGPNVEVAPQTARSPATLNELGSERRMQQYPWSSREP
jgi:hypothetical protein